MRGKNVNNEGFFRLPHSFQFNDPNFAIIDDVFATVVADEKRVLVFLVVDSDEATDRKQKMADLFLSVARNENWKGLVRKLESGNSELTGFDNLPDDAFSYSINANQLFRVFKTHSFDI